MRLIMRGFVAGAAAFLLLSATPLQVTAEPSGLDFDGDGLSEMIGFEIQHDGSPNEIALTYLSTSTGLISRNEFGKSSEISVSADYNGDGISDLAVVGPDEANNFRWRIKLSGTGGETVSTFGQVGGTILSGCSFDGDNIADRAIYFGDQFISVEKSSDLSVFTLDLGVALEQLTCGDITGDGFHDLVGQRSGTSGRSEFFAWDMSSQTKILEQAFGQSVGAILTADIDGDGMREIGYIKKRGASARSLEFLKNGAAVSLLFPKFISASVIKTSGDAGAADGVFLKAPSNDTFYRVASLANPAAFETVKLSDTQGVLSGVNFGYPGPLRSRETGCQEHHTPNDGNEGFLWKPVSDTNGRAVVILPRGIRLKQMRLVKNGKELDKLSYGGNGNGGRDHWRSRFKASTFGSNTTVMGVQGGVTHCWLISDPLQRMD